MSDRGRPLTDYEVDQVIGRLLQVGVLIAAAVVLVAGILLLKQSGSALAAYSVFRGQPAELRSIDGVVRGVAAADSAAIVQLGLLLLIATPIARVAFTLVAFAIQRDRTFVIITSIVLALLLFGLVFGAAA
jgi:uncharacterized membrane protein